MDITAASLRGYPFIFSFDFSFWFLSLSASAADSPYSISKPKSHRWGLWSTSGVGHTATTTVNNYLHTIMHGRKLWAFVKNFKRLSTDTFGILMVFLFLFLFLGDPESKRWGVTGAGVGGCGSLGGETEEVLPVLSEIRYVSVCAVSTGTLSSFLFSDWSSRCFILWDYVWHFSLKNPLVQWFEF